MPKFSNLSLKKLSIVATAILVIAVAVFTVAYIGYKAEEEAPVKVIALDDIDTIDKREDLSQKKSLAIDRELSLDKPQVLDKAFSSIKEEFSPATLEYKDQAALSLAKLKDTRKNIIQLSGFIAQEFFAFGVYDDLKDGRLVRAKEFSFEAQGRDTKKITTLEFTLDPNEAKNGLQLPIILNGAVIVDDSRNKYKIDKKGKIYFKEPIKSPLLINYRIARRINNAKLSIDPAHSEYLKKEFAGLPLEVRLFLDDAKLSFDEYKIVTVCAILNELFGYQRGAIRVELTPGITWSEYLRRQLKRRTRFLCDCDVLSTYAYIFLKYLGFDATVLVGYDNRELKGVDVLTADEYHANIYVKFKGKWLLFDPSLYVPQFASQSKNNLPVQEKSDLWLGYPSKNLTAQYFDFPLKSAEFLGSVIFDQSETDKIPDLTQKLADLKLNQNRLKTLFRKKIVIKPWTDMIVLISLSILAIFSLFLRFVKVIFKQKEKSIRLSHSSLNKLLSKTFLILSVGYLLFSALGFELGFWRMQKLFLVIAASLLILGLIILIIANSELLKLQIGKFYTFDNLWKSKNIYQFSRNPLSLGYLLISIAACLYAPSLWILAITFGFCFFQRRLIREEEAFFENNFEISWKAYSEKVARYL